jgi:hypothetical protein
MNWIYSLCFYFIIKTKVVWLSWILLLCPTNGFAQSASLVIFTNNSQMVYIFAIYVILLVHALWMFISTQQFKLMIFSHVMPMWKALGFFHCSNWKKIPLQNISVYKLLWLSSLVIWCTSCYDWVPWLFESYWGFFTLIQLGNLLTTMKVSKFKMPLS